MDLARQFPNAAALLDGVRTVKFDGAPMEARLDAAGDFAMRDIAMSAASAVQVWAGSAGDMDEGEGVSDRLMMMLVGVVDEDKDGELTDDEAELFDAAATAAYDYMASKGASASDLDAIFSEDIDASNAAAERVRDLLAGVVPADEGDAVADIDSFAFADGGDEAMFDAVYKKRFAIRKGKKVMVRKRVAGFVRRSAKQKLATRKAARRAQSGAAKLRRMKSAKMGRRMGLGGR